MPGKLRLGYEFGGPSFCAWIVGELRVRSAGFGLLNLGLLSNRVLALERRKTLGPPLSVFLSYGSPN